MASARAFLCTSFEKNEMRLNTILQDRRRFVHKLQACNRNLGLQGVGTVAALSTGGDFLLTDPGFGESASPFHR